MLYFISLGYLLLQCMVTLWLTTVGLAKLFSKVVCTILQPHLQCMKVTMYTKSFWDIRSKFFQFFAYLYTFLIVWSSEAKSFFFYFYFQVIFYDCCWHFQCHIYKKLRKLRSQKYMPMFSSHDTKLLAPTFKYFIHN